MPCCTSLNPSSLSNGTVGISYNQSVSAICEAGATSTITFFSGTLPTGLTFTAGTESMPATITGTPTTEGTFTFRLRLTNTGVDPACASPTFQYTIIIERRRRGGKGGGVMAIDIGNDMIRILKTLLSDPPPLQILVKNILYNYSRQDNYYYYYTREPSDPTPPPPPPPTRFGGGNGSIPTDFNL